MIFYLDCASLNDVEGVDRWLDCRGKVVLEILRYLLICFQRRKSPVSEPADSYRGEVACSGIIDVK